MLQVTELSSQKVAFHLGANGALDNVPVWTSDKSGVAELFPTPDGMNCVAQAAGPGTITLTATVNAGGVALAISATLTVTAVATQLTLSADAPVAQ